MEPTRSIMDFNAVPWVNMDEAFNQRGGRGTAEMKALTAPDGKRVGLIHANGEGKPHFHTKPSSFFILKGSMVLRDRVAGPGTWGIEPYGAIHPNTKFCDVTYGLGMAEGDFGIGNMVMERVEDVPDWAIQAGFKQDNFSTFVDTPDVAWLPFGDGLSIKIMHVFEGRGSFASLIKADAGAKLPRRRYLGPCDMYIISGRAVFGNAVASEGCWVHEPAGADEGEVQFPVDTEFLSNTYGTILEFAKDGSVSRVIEGFALRDLSHVRMDSARSVASYGQSELQDALARFAAVSAPPRGGARVAAG